MNKHEKYERHPGMKYCYVILETSEYKPMGNLGLKEHTHTLRVGMLVCKGCIEMDREIIQVIEVCV